MEKFKDIYNTIIKKAKDIWFNNIKDSKFVELIFFSFLLVMVILSVMGICVAMSSNKYKSAIVTTKPLDGEIKELNETSSFLNRNDKDLDNNTVIDSDKNQIQLPIATPEEVLTISCTSATKDNIKLNDDLFPTSVVEQVTAKFDAKTKKFYQADVSIALYYLLSSVDDLESLQAIYEKRLNTYASYFKLDKTEVVFSEPTEAYINLKDLDYDTYYEGYRKETETYDSFLYTFEAAHYQCKV